MGKFYIITHDDGERVRDFYFQDIISAILQFREFMEQVGIKEKIKWPMPVRFEYGDWKSLTLREQGWDDNKLYHL